MIPTKKKTTSIVQLLGVELLALIEYAVSNPTKVHVDTEQLKSALLSIASAEAADKVNTEASYVPVGKKANAEYKANLDKSKQKYAEKLNENLKSDVLIQRMMDVCGDAIDGDEDELSSLYKLGGSVLKFFEYDKQLKKDNQQSLICEDDIRSSMVYFVPMQPVLEQYEQLLVTGKITPNDAITYTNKNKAILCNYDLNQEPDNDGCKYIEGAKEGLLVLSGQPIGYDQPGTGLLAKCGDGLESVTSDSFIKRKHPTTYRTYYHIRLTSSEAAAFEQQLKDDSSILRTDGVQLTAVNVMSNTSTDYSGPGDLEGDGGQQDTLEQKLVNGNKYQDTGMDLEKSKYEILSGSVRYAMNVINSYMSCRVPNKPEIRVTPPKFTNQPDDDLLKMVSYISEVAVKFGAIFGTKVDTTYCQYNDETYVIALYNYINASVVNRVTNYSPKGALLKKYPQLFMRIRAMNKTLRAFCSKIQEMLHDVFDSIRFTQTAESTVSDEQRAASKKSAEAFEAISSQQCAITPSESITIDDICRTVENFIAKSDSDSIVDDITSSDLIPTELSNAIKRYFAMSSQITAHVAVPLSDIERMKNTVLPVIVKYGVHHAKAFAEWNRMKDARIDVPLANTVKPSSIQQLVSDPTILADTSDMQFKSLARNLLDAFNCMSSYNYDGGQQIAGTDYIDLMRSSVSSLTTKYASKSKPVEQPVKQKKKAAYSALAMKVNDLAEQDAQRQTALNKIKRSSSVSASQPADPTSDSKDLTDDDLMARQMEYADFDAW